MVSGGLSWTDFGKKEVIGGYALEFYARAGKHYEMSRYGQELAWMHEPHVAEEIFRVGDIGLRKRFDDLPGRIVHRRLTSLFEKGDCT